MNASLYFELVDAVAGVEDEAGLRAVAQRVAATPMHPLERRVLDRSLRARTEALALRCQLEMPVSLDGSSAQPKSLVAIG